MARGRRVIYIDTSALVARVLENDDNHEAAVLEWERLSRSGDALAITDAVIVEMAATLYRKIAQVHGPERGRDEAATNLSALLASRRLSVLAVSADDRFAAADDWAKASDPKTSYADSMSFVAMRRHDIRHVFTFDHRHFGAEGFRIIP